MSSVHCNISNGDYQQTSGEYLVNGEPCHFNSPREAVASAAMTANVTSSLDWGFLDSKEAKKGSIISMITRVLVR